MRLFIVFSLIALATVHGAVDLNSLLKYRLCPIVDCAYMACLDSGMQSHTSYFNINGMKCPGCNTCSRLPIDIREAVNPIQQIVKLNICPMTMCAFPGNCDPSTYIQNYFDWNGKQCPGCVSCPSGGLTANVLKN